MPVHILFYIYLIYLYFIYNLLSFLQATIANLNTAIQERDESRAALEKTHELVVAELSLVRNSLQASEDRVTALEKEK